MYMYTSHVRDMTIMCPVVNICTCIRVMCVISLSSELLFKYVHDQHDHRVFSPVSICRLHTFECLLGLELCLKFLSTRCLFPGP